MPHITNSINTMFTTMKAIVISRFGGPEMLQHRNVPKPIPENGFALIEVFAFGLNHAETHMRKGEWDQWNPISGIECVELVSECPGGEFTPGQKVVAVMGGMGRTIPGSYGEFVNVPVTNVVALEATLPWQLLAAIPEAYGTAWTCVSTILDVQPGEQVLIRGATSTIGQEALKLAARIGAIITATTRRASQFDKLKTMGAAETKLETPQVSNKPHDSQHESLRFDKVLNLIGNSVLLDSIGLTRSGGRMLQAGWLGGLEPVSDFDPMTQMASGVHFSLFHSKMLGSADFPLADIPLQEIVREIEKGELDVRPACVFRYEDIRGAHRMLEKGDSGGKIVVKH